MNKLNVVYIVPVALGTRVKDRNSGAHLSTSNTCHALTYKVIEPGHRTPEWEGLRSDNQVRAQIQVVQQEQVRWN